MDAPAQAPTTAPEAAPTTPPAETTAPEPTQSIPTSSSTPPTGDSSPNPFQQFADDVASGRTRGSDSEGNASGGDASAQPASEDGLPDTSVDWKTSLPQAYRDNPYIGRFNSMDDFLQGVENLQKLAGRKGLEKPPEGADDSAWEEYWQAVGRPETPESYKIENIKDSTGADVYEFDQAMMAEQLKDFHKQGLTNEQAQFVMERYAQLDMAQQADKKAAHELQTTQTYNSLNQEFGERTDTEIRRGLAALENMGIYQTLVDHGLETNEAMVRAGIKMSRELGEATVGAEVSVKSSMQRIEEIEASPAFWNANDPMHKSAVAERNRILERMS